MPKREPDFQYYRKALGYYAAKENYLKRELQRILFTDFCDSSECTPRFRDALCDFYDALGKPAEFFFSLQELQ